jgi:hypothetical protein
LFVFVNSTLGEIAPTLNAITIAKALTISFRVFSRYYLEHPVLLKHKSGSPRPIIMFPPLNMVANKRPLSLSCDKVKVALGYLMGSP